MLHPRKSSWTCSFLFLLNRKFRQYCYVIHSYTLWFQPFILFRVCRLSKIECGGKTWFLALLEKYFFSPILRCIFYHIGVSSTKAGTSCFFAALLTNVFSSVRWPYLRSYLRLMNLRSFLFKLLKSSELMRLSAYGRWRWYYCTLNLLTKADFVDDVQKLIHMLLFDYALKFLTESKLLRCTNNSPRVLYALPHATIWVCSGVFDRVQVSSMYE